MSERTALLVIDVQVGMFEDEPEPPHDADRLLANIRGLIDRARASGVEVIYVRHVDDRFDGSKLGARGWQMHPSIAPESEEAVIDKWACDAFYGTPLQEELAARGIEHLVIAGMQTELCIDTACRSALHRDFNVTLAADAHSTWNSKHLTAAQIIAHHNATLANLPHPTKEIVVRPSAAIVFAQEPSVVA
jgi:nicotinamidase-related amidase